MAKDAYYFPHDSNARNDQMMLMLRSKFGAAGYGNYFMIVEMLREQEDFKLPNNDLLFDSLTLALGIDNKEIRALVALCEKLKLLTRDGSGLYSRSLIRRMEKLTAIREARKLAGRAGGKARARQAEGEGKQSSSKAQAKPKQNPSSRPSRPKRVRKEQNERPAPAPPARFVRPTLTQIKVYCDERLNGVDPSAFLAHYEANGWIRGKTQIQDWKACVRTWEAQHGGPGTRKPSDQQKAQECVSCGQQQALKGAKVCKDCSWCVVCDADNREGKKDPKILVRHPKEQRGAICPECLGSLCRKVA